MAISWQVSNLDNGLRLATTPVPTAQSASVIIFVGVGSRMERRRSNGISHFVEHMLFKGSAARPSALAISEAIEGAGGVLNAFTNRELTAYWCQVPYDKLDLAVDVLGDMVTRPLLDAAEIDRERSVVLQEIRRAKDQPAAWATELLARAAYGDQPVGWPIAGREESVAAVRRRDFVDHLARWYVPGNTVVSVAGNVAPDRVLNLVARKLGDMRPSEPPSYVPARPGLPRQRIRVDARPTEQSNLTIGFRSLARKDPDRYAFAVLNSILGRGMSSRLFKEVRERRGLAYSVGSGVTRYHDTGMLAISAGVSPEKAKEAAEVILVEVFRLNDEPVPDDELARGRDYTVGNFRLSLETTMALAQYTGDSLLTMREIEDVDEVVAKLTAVTAADIQRVARRFFTPDNVAMGVVGPDASPRLLAKALGR